MLRIPYPIAFARMAHQRVEVAARQVLRFLSPFTALFLLAMTSGCSQPAESVTPTDALTVQTQTGLLHGKLEGNSRVFLGIPYAASPAGEMRWRAPLPALEWEGLREAAEFGPSCMQAAKNRNNPQSEDCLFLNVWAPAASPEKLRPVLVWIHGGGFTVGSGSIPMLNGLRLSEAGDIVVVNFNYRLGALGFYASPALDAESSLHSSGAFGLLDQVAALQWVRDNISAFRDDPTQVTLGGYSAGAMSVCYHLASPKSRGLFKRAIIQSGVCNRETPSLHQYEESWAGFAADLGCDDTADALACLRSKDPQEVMKAAKSAGDPKPGGMMFQDMPVEWRQPPAIDGDFLTEPAAAALEKKGLPIAEAIVGATANEGAEFPGDFVPTDEQGYIDALTRRYGSRVSQVAQQYPLSAYASPKEALGRVVGDELFYCQALFTAERLRNAGVKVFLYRFERPLQNLRERFGDEAFHTSDQPYLFGNDYLNAELLPTDRSYGESVMKYWTRFIRSGDTNAKGEPVWPDFGQSAFMTFGEELKPGTDFGGAECEFWRTFSAAQ